MVRKQETVTSLVISVGRRQITLIGDPDAAQISILSGGDIHQLQIGSSLHLDEATLPHVAAAGILAALQELEPLVVRVPAAFGAIEVSANAGSLTLQDLQAQTLRVRTISGAVRGRLTVSDLQIISAMGALDLRLGRFRQAALKTDSGDISLQLPEDFQDLQVQSESGAVRISCPEGLRAKVEAESRSGTVQAVRLTESPDRHIRVHSGSGPIIIR